MHLGISVRHPAKGNRPNYPRFWICFVTAGCLILWAPARAREYSGTRTRSVQGMVTDRTGRPVAGAAVELENTQTLDIRSFLTDEDGKYHFEDLYSNVDYKLRVQYHGTFGPSKRLSQFSSRKDSTINLRVDGGG
jgi:hypothetical protein